MEKGKQIVGVGVIIWKDGKVLLGKRLNAHGQHTYASPGGRLEMGESFEACARRETIEETGLLIENIRFNHLANVLYYPPNQFVHIGMSADWKAGEPKLMEPEKCEGWDWYDPEHLPKPLFFQTSLFFETQKTKKFFYDQKDLEHLL